MKAKKFVSHSAKFDLKEAAEWYNEARKGLGFLFLTEVKQTINYITENPLTYGIRYSNIRIAFTSKFPYGVHYEYIHHKHQVNILAVYHTSRDPEIWEQENM